MPGFLKIEILAMIHIFRMDKLLDDILAQIFGKLLSVDLRAVACVYISLCEKINNLPKVIFYVHEVPGRHYCREYYKWAESKISSHIVIIYSIAYNFKLFDIAPTYDYPCVPGYVISYITLQV